MSHAHSVYVNDTHFESCSICAAQKRSRCHGGHQLPHNREESFSMYTTKFPDSVCVEREGKVLLSFMSQIFCICL
jgi:hypothetical protein